MKKASAGSPGRTASSPAAPPAGNATGAMLEHTLAAHQQGRLAEARAGYEEILRLEPAHFDALHLLGAMALQRGETQQGVDLIRRAIEVNPRHASAHFNLAGGLRDLQREDEALASYDRAIALKPDFADAWHHRGNALRALDRLAEAVASYEQATALRPGLTDAWNRRGNVLQSLNRVEQALESYDRAIALEPGHAVAHNNRGNALQRLNRQDEGLASYDKAIALAPDFAAAHYNRGTALQALGRPGEALESHDRALALKPDYAEAWHNRAIVLKILGRPDEALASCERAIAVRPEYAEAWSNRGSVLADLNRPEAALESFGRAIELNPDLAEAWSNRGNCLKNRNLLPDALASFERAVALKPDFAEAWSNHGNCLKDLGRLEEALASYDRAVALGPDLPSALNNRGNVLRDLKRPEEALASLERALALDPGYAEAWSSRGCVLRDLKRLDESLECHDKAVALKPDFAEMWSNRGNTLKDLHRFGEALESYGRAIALKPDLAQAWFNCGATFDALNRPRESLASYEKSIALRPDYAPGHWNESLCRLLLGDYEAGWRKYEWRWQVESLAPSRPGFRQPLWLGAEPLQGRTMLLYAEQGLGDTIQFCRYAKLVAARGARVFLMAQTALQPLLAGLEGVSRVLAPGESLSAFDYHCPLVSLPLAFDTRLDTIPAGVPYLFGDTRKLSRWRERLGAKTTPRVAIVWAGSAKNRNDRNRSLPLERLLGAIPQGIACYSLQKELREGDRETLAGRPGIVHLGEELADFADTAAVLDLMDLVLCVDTAIAHLAGAMGKPVWVLLPFAPDWRWLLEREDSPWYPTARLFRQPAIGDWDSVLARVRQELSGYGTPPARREASAASLARADAPQDAALDAKLKQALAAHQQGRLAEARAGYEEILRLEPAHFDALHLLGAMALQRGETQQGVDLIRRAIEVNPRHASAHFNLAGGLRDLQREDEALASYDRAIALKPDFTDAWNRRGNTLQSLNRMEQALESYDRAIALEPGHAMAHNNRGNALQRLNRQDEGLASYDKAIALAPGFATALYNRGTALQALGRPGEALENHDRALALKPDYAEAWHNRGIVLQTLTRPEAALESYSRAISLKPAYAEAWLNRGRVLRELKRPQEALASYERAIELKPDLAQAWSSRGEALRDLNRLDEALESYSRVIALKADLARSYSNRAVVLQYLGRPAEAIGDFVRATTHDPDYAPGHWNEGMCRLLQGDFEAGWRKYEWRWRRNSVKHPGFSQPLWLGAEPLQGKTILLYPEQGFGDTIQFCRYAKLAAARGARVLLVAQAALKPLLDRVEGVSRVLHAETLPDFDYHCPLLSLPLAFDTRLDTIPAGVPYLFGDTRKLSQWRKRLGKRTAPRVAIVWAGSATNRNDRNRSLPLTRLLRAIPQGVACYSLQKDLREGDRETLAGRPDVVHLGEELADFADTAAVLDLMDLVLCVDTAIAHLAGAMGKPVWVLLPFAPDWRWLLEREDSPWYPTARLFRQPAIGDWDSVLARVRQELSGYGAPPARRTQPAPRPVAAAGRRKAPAKPRSSASPRKRKGGKHG